MAKDVFSVPVFLVVFRETLETVIIVSVLLAFLKQTLDGPNADRNVYKKLRAQIWIGVATGFLLCMIIAAALIGVFYTVGSNTWDQSEQYYEGAFSLVASIIITLMGAALLRIGKMQDKWRVKLAKAIESPIKVRSSDRGWFAQVLEKYAMFFLPFITVLREGIEAVVFVAGVTFSAPAYAVPLPVTHRGGSSTKLQYFLVASTCLLYLVGAGLFSRAVWSLEQGKWNKIVGSDASELGSGPGSYDIDNVVWHVNCCNPNVPNNGGWGIFQAILGWTNSATYGSVISYNLYWLFVMASFILIRFHETKGRWPFQKAKAAVPSDTEARSGSESHDVAETKNVSEKTTALN
ncbi:iron permease-like protein [Trichoderma reesei QM6a]|uniref:Iron permease-like protein n=2 Tax=Hypocrea jecorina TaxID=51453 RepID=G0R8D2_HYPJQ|nr:iron permease-like protein [Trichoderma reesei QM6a]EGR52329.1 iron permease-like protein [Trichoderma reesei QM6a]ETS06633.1 putative iron transferase [Trichoderma reesei RUT C-30]